MHLNFTQQSKHDFHLSHSLPLDFNSYILRGGNILTATSPSLGSIVLQEFINHHYSIRFNRFDFLKPFKLKGLQAGSRLVSFLALKNNIRYTIKGVGTMELNQGQFALLHTSDRPAVAEFTKLKPHECIEISWSDEWLQQMLGHFQFLQRLFVPEDKRESFFVHTAPRPAGAKALDLVNAILTTPFDASISRLVFESKVREYLIMLLIEAAKEVEPAVSLTNRERETLVALGKRISTTYNKKFLNEELAREMGMNVTKLKDGFKEIHGVSISAMNMAVRMNEARRLLMETDYNIKEIKSLIGYKLTTSFVVKFYEFFGYHSSAVPRRGKR